MNFLGHSVKLLGISVSFCNLFLTLLVCVYAKFISITNVVPFWGLPSPCAVGGISILTDEFALWFVWVQTIPSLGEHQELFHLLLPSGLSLQPQSFHSCIMHRSVLGQKSEGTLLQISRAFCAAPSSVVISTSASLLGSLNFHLNLDYWALFRFPVLGFTGLKMIVSYILTCFLVV